MWNTIDEIHSVEHEQLMKSFGTNYSMTNMVAKDRFIENIPYARYACDARFHETNSPPGLKFSEPKRFFSEKHKVYGFKVEVSVLPSGICVYTGAHVPGCKRILFYFEKHILASDYHREDD